MTELREQVGIRLDRRGDVRQGPQRDEVVSTGFVRRDVEQRSDGVVGVGCARWQRQRGPAHAIFTVDELRGVERALQGLGPSRVQWNVGTTTQVERDDGIADREIERHVAGDDGDGAHVDRGLSHGQHERDRVVGCGVGVDHDAAHHRSLPARPPSTPKNASPGALSATRGTCFGGWRRRRRRIDGRCTHSAIMDGRRDRARPVPAHP